jgi:hypothetical protein
MPTWIVELPGEWKAVIDAPAIFIFTLVVLAVGIWSAVSWSYRSLLRNKDGEMRLLERQLSAYKEKLEGASPEEAKARIDQMEQQLKKLTPRKLSQEQKQTLEQNLRHLGAAHSVSILTDMSCSDGAKYGADIGHLLSSSLGWAITSGGVIGPAYRPPTGLGIQITGAIPVGTELAVGQAFQRAGVDFDYLPGTHSQPPGGPRTALGLFVGHPLA